jgi:hypothetical protein
MASAVHHAMSAAKKFGGEWTSYIEIENWFDATKAWIPDSRHRAMRHHAEGIFECEKVFGPTVKVPLKGGVIKEVPTRLIGEQHVIEDCGFIPKAWDYVQGMKKDLWMRKVGVKLDVNLEGKLTEEKDIAL